MVPQDDIQSLMDPLQIQMFLNTLQETKHLEPEKNQHLSYYQ